MWVPMSESASCSVVPSTGVGPDTGSFSAFALGGGAEVGFVIHLDTNALELGVALDAPWAKLVLDSRHPRRGRRRDRIASVRNLHGTWIASGSRVMRKTCMLLALLLAATTAWADAPGATPTMDRPMTVHIRPPKHESTATVLTLAGIAAPFVLTYLTYERNTDNPMYAPIGGITGLVLPAMGHWYAGRVGTYGMLLRLGGLMSAVVGLSYLDDADRCDRGEQVSDGCAPSNRTTGRVAIAIGLATWASSWVYDVVSARREVRRYNRRTTVQIMPILAPNTSGVAIGGAF